MFVVVKRETGPNDGRVRTLGKKRFYQAALVIFLSLPCM
jgi:hypothetical protein